LKLTKRDFIKLSGAFGFLAQAGFFGISATTYAKAGRWQQSWFSTRDLSDTFKTMGIDEPTINTSIIVNTPDTAENGAFVGVSVKSSLESTNAIAILVDKNPSVLAGYFEFGDIVNPELATKIKMAETSNVIALVKSNDKYFFNKKNVNVTLGGCGS
jgi:sulfur-oxidizing protein SoxY